MISLKQIVGKVVAACCAAVALSACGDGVVYDTYNHTQLNGWEKNDTLFFDVPPMVNDGRYRQSLGLRINESYPFTGLTLVVDQTVEPGHRQFTDTVRCRLVDAKGNMLGQGVSYYQYDFIVSDMELHRGDSLHIEVRHIMKREILPGIADIGMKMNLLK